MDIAKLEEGLCALPLCQYELIDTSELVFSQRIRTVCEQECPMYNKSWACPPAVGTVEECQARCLRFPRALMLTTVTEVRDITDIHETLLKSYTFGDSGKDKFNSSVKTEWEIVEKAGMLPEGKTVDELCAAVAAYAL